MLSKRKVTKNKGFTLIELLVVIAIVALLASVAILAMNNARQGSRDTKRTADIKQISSALEIYFEEYKQYPYNGPAARGGYEEIDVLDAVNNRRWDSGCQGNDPSDAFLTPLQTAKIMTIIPNDPIYKEVGNCYLYTTTSNTSPYPYTNNYYLAARYEGAANNNNCGITLSGKRFCLTQAH